MLLRNEDNSCGRRRWVDCNIEIIFVFKVYFRCFFFFRVGRVDIKVIEYYIICFFFSCKY